MPNILLAYTALKLVCYGIHGSTAFCQFLRFKRNDILVPENFQFGCIYWFFPCRGCDQRLTPEPVFTAFNSHDFYY